MVATTPRSPPLRRVREDGRGCRAGERGSRAYGAVGVGEVPAQDLRELRSASAPAFYAARAAVEAAKLPRRRGLVVICEPDSAYEQRALALENCLFAIKFIVSRRTAAQRRVAHLAQAGRTRAEISDELAITKQAISQLWHQGGIEEERRLVALAGFVAGELLGAR